MATVKLATLLIRTIAKPISAQLKNQATQHPTFRSICVSLANKMYMGEIKLRTNILGEPARQHVRPLSEARAIENGANALAEGFLFSVAALLILGEAYRTSRNESKRRDNVDDKLDDLAASIQSLVDRVDGFTTRMDDIERENADEKIRNAELERIVERMVEIGLRGGWVEFEGTPLMVPKVQLAPRNSPNSLPRDDSPPS
ncbi:optic atrophy 3 protein-domain-containing protein [Hygrophoropsis aurantiaca]|uniref:Optic atrophy 3 protein-domain-containing protein n=1 Tax=Hygrophoropsis aurantiaca TaxID=72124 RepID=A0ACB8A567_9AGAM|nr:optic atrophy 3 protein-domain-containing protein [Hygrophoropsis aurantiaca]